VPESAVQGRYLALAHGAVRPWRWAPGAPVGRSKRRTERFVLAVLGRSLLPAVARDVRQDLSRSPLMRRTCRTPRRWALSGLGTLPILATVACVATSGRRTVADAQDAGCASCHAEESHDLRTSAHRSGHGQGVGCTGCHLPHVAAGAGAGPGPAGLRRTCEECHGDVALELQLPHTHRPGTGVTCTSCHEPHHIALNGLHVPERRDACVACHLEVRGPYTYEHEGDRRLACMSCHGPHGSGNRRMLTYPDSLSLCLSCHPLLEDHDLSFPVWRDCLNCHTEVHGSRWDRALLR